MDRGFLSWLIGQGQRHPERAPEIARQIAGYLREHTGAGPSSYSPSPEYLYSGSHRWVLRREKLAVEPTPIEQPNAAAITDATIRVVSFRIPFDAIIWGVASSATVRPTSNEALAREQFAGVAACNRDLFSVDWGLAGKVSFSTDGNNRTMAPGAVTTGTADLPRQMAWTVRRNDTIQARFRNLLNFFWNVTIVEGFPFEWPEIDVELVFFALNLEGP